MDPRARAIPAGKAKKSKKRTQSPVKKFIFTVVKILVVFFLALGCAVSGILGGAILGYLKMAKPISDEDLISKNLTTFIYDAEGNVLKSLTGKDNINREWASYEEIPDYLKEAFISVEDERFYQHKGVDIIGILRAVTRKILNPTSKMEGGSTITQQLARNITGQTQVTLQRKVQEWYQAIDLERRYKKWQILESYMNLVYFGNSYYGVRSASKGYFGKDVTELSLAECALLAGITNNPSIYNPYTEKGRKAAKDRQKIILRLMLEQGKIDERQYEQALEEEIVFCEKSEAKKSSTTQSYFVDQVILDVKRDLMEEKGWSETMALAQIYSGGLHIYTTMDPDVQRALDEVFNDSKYFIGVEPKTKTLLEHPEAGMVIIDPNTGEVKGMRGGYGELDASMTLNRATQIQRQPGSSFKPIAVYAPALDLHKITPATVYDDVAVYFGTGKNKNKPYPNNYDHTYGGLTSIRDAVKRSVNVVAALVWMDIGPDNSISYLKKVGIDRPEERYLSIAMGGLHKGVSPLEMAAAYVPFVHKGMYFEPITYIKVTDSNGKIVLEKKPKYETVYDERTAFLMTSMLRDVTSAPGGTAYGKGIIKNADGKVIPTAGKTGTTSDNKDKWFVGFSPYYVAATWYGYDHPRQLIGNERNQALIIWHDVMEKIHQYKEPIDFEQPSGIVKKAVCIYSGKTPSPLCYKDPRGSAVREEYFIKGTEPKSNEVCDVHVSAKVCTQSKDEWGRNLLAGPYCPAESVAEKVFIQRPVPYTPKEVGEKAPKDLQYELPAGEYCTIHGEPQYGTVVPSESGSEITQNEGSEGNSGGNRHQSNEQHENEAQENEPQEDEDGLDLLDRILNGLNILNIID